jgi:two-component system cell cycle sensor histidine kinase/response regulator CckA
VGSPSERKDVKCGAEAIRRHDLLGNVPVETLLQIVTESARVGLVIVSPDRRYAYANATYAEILGLASPDIVGRRLQDVLAEVYQEQVQPRLDRAFAGERVGYELRKSTGNGDRYYAVSYEPTEADGSVAFVVVVITDITERRQTQVDSSRFVAIVESSEDAIISKDLDGIVTSWNDASEKIFGYSAAEMLGTSIMRLIPADRQDEERHILGKIRRNESVQHFETLRQTKNGRSINVSVTASPIRDSAGKVIGVSKVARDISEKKIAYEAMRFQQTMLMTERELTLDGILVVDAQSKVLSYNGRFAQMWGISSEILATRADEQLLQAVSDKLLHPDRFMEGVRQLYDRHDEASHDEVELADGRTFDRYSAPMRDSDGRYYGRVWYFRDVTERKQAEVSLRHERDRAQRYLDTAGVILLALDMQGRITLVNRFACSAFGWTAKELIGRDFIDACVPAGKRQASRKNLSAVRLGDDSVFANEIVTRSGEERLIEWRATLLRNDAGEIVGTFSSGSDITERRRAEAALRAERDRAQRYLDTADVILLALDPEGRITLINRKGCDLLGWTEAELLGRDWVEICLPQAIRGALTQKFENLLGGELSIVENPVRTRGGEERLIEWRNSVLRDEQGRVTGTFSSGADITERHQAVEALRTAEERMRFALENAGVGIWDMDYSTGIARMSEILESQYGMKPGTYAGTFEAFIDGIHPEDRQNVLDVLDKAMKSGADFSNQYRALWPDGTVRWLSNAGRIQLGEQGEPLRGVGISMDITERRTLEEQYHQSQKMEAVGRLAGGVAHDFNNLLTAILGYCQLLLADLDPHDPRREDVTEIHKAGESAAGLTRQLLTFSRKQIIEPKVLDLNAVVGNMRGLLDRIIGEDVKVVLNLRAGLATVKADAGQMEQIVLNLAVNARDAMPNGGTLTIETANVDIDENYANTHFSVKPGPYVGLTVTDTGTGMPPEVQARLFEPFFTTKEIGKGTGLGLATVHGIVARSGGSIGAYSEVGKGTSFTAYFPHAAGGGVSADLPARAVQAHAADETLLVVEDGEALRILAKRILERQGYRVLLAANAGEALHLFKSNEVIDLILTDVIMPGGSGPELTRRLVAERPGLKVLYMSGYTEDAISHHGVLDPGIAFLNKPFTSESLGRKIREVLDGSAQPSP